MLSTLALAAAFASQCAGGSCATPTNYGAYLPRPQYAAPVVPPAALYRLTDRNGTNWQHADPAVLGAHVARINAGAPPRFAYPAYLPFTRGCSGGRCQ
jgi:hypothetical protein